MSGFLIFSQSISLQYLGHFLKIKRQKRQIWLYLVCMTLVAPKIIFGPSSTRVLVSSFSSVSSRRFRSQNTVASFIRQSSSSIINNSRGSDRNKLRMKVKSEEEVVAKLVPSSKLEECGSRLRDGHLVAFPTETVYGLGCHALDTTAVARVFCAKERPTTDPLIVHLNSADQALPLWDIPDQEEKECLQILMESFWPGPLTLVARANGQVVPPLLTADTGFVACRSPSHPLARSLIEAARVPIAAPSANKFGHVSPTQAQHVFDDLHGEDVWIIEYEPKNSCQVGVESTVVKIEWDSNKDEGSVILLRHGAISASQIQKSLLPLKSKWQVSVRPRHTSEDTANVAPGQSIRHYSPHYDCFMISANKDSLEEQEKSMLSQVVVIDFAGQLQFMRNFSLAYRDLSAKGSSQEASASLFDTLRWSETIHNATRVYVPQIDTTQCGSGENQNKISQKLDDDPLLWAIQDRITRAASGVIIEELI